MAQGSIIWRCRKQCGNRTSGTCDCSGAQYYIIYPVGRRRKWEPAGQSKKNAEKLLTQRLSELHRGIYREIKKTGFSEFVDQWLRDFAGTRIKVSTYRSYSRLLKLHLKPYFKDYLLSQIEARDIQRFIASKANETDKKKKLSGRSINYLIMVLKMMMKCAKQWRLLHENPAEGISRVRQEHKEMDYLKPDEALKFLKPLREPYRTLFLTAILTGMRRGELLGFQWGDINWVDNLIYVRRSLYWRLKSETGKDSHRWVFSPPKSVRSIRAITMSPKLREALEIHRIKGAVSPQGLVFCTPEGTPMDPDNMVKIFKESLTTAGVRHIRFHDLRHTYTALLIAQGAHAKFIQTQLGHASIQTTMDLYGHLMPQMYEGVGEKLDQQIFSASANEKVAAVVSTAS